MKNINRAIIIVMDSLGVGELPDSEKFGDKGANTFNHILEKKPDLKIPNLLDLGFGNIDHVAGGKLKVENPKGSFGRAMEISNGKDTITGHWEIGGVETKKSFKTYPDGFPESFIQKFQKEIGREVLGNYPESGTVIIDQLGKEHEETGKPIVYTSADSVFQIAANIEVIPLEELYHICEIARRLLVGDVACGRVIARPYKTVDGKRIRTSDRKDYAVNPPIPTFLDRVKGKGEEVYCIGKISDIFNGNGVTIAIHTENNMDGVEKTIEAIKKDFKGLIFTNLVEFDSLYGHRRDPIGYGKAIEEFDERLPEIMRVMKEEDILILCADHGNDPTHTGWDHTREHIPVVVYGKNVMQGKNLGTLKTYGDIGQTVVDMVHGEPLIIGTSFLKRIIKD